MNIKIMQNLLRNISMGSYVHLQDLSDEDFEALNKKVRKLDLSHHIAEYLRYCANEDSNKSGKRIIGEY
jgi:hypothetical protein